MLARGVDMTQQFSCHPKLHEGSSLNANDYVRLAEGVNGPLPPLDQRGELYIWGDAIEILEEKKPDLRIINLETSVTTAENFCRRKAIHYRMHPKNVNLLTGAKIDCCVLSNNHTADWGFGGLTETLETLNAAGVGYTGAGHNLAEAESPFVLEVAEKGRVLVVGVGDRSSGVPTTWAAKKDHCGVNVLPVEETSVKKLKVLIRRHKRRNDIVILSIHWGDNWGFELDPGFREFAHDLIDSAGVDIVHGHSSHHVKAIEVYKKKLIMYGCGDFINDYEGIGGNEEHRGDLSLMYFVTVNPGTGNVSSVSMVPTTMKKLQVKRVTNEEDIDWLFNTMHRECKKYGTEIYRENDELILK